MRTGIFPDPGRIRENRGRGNITFRDEVTSIRNCVMGFGDLTFRHGVVYTIHGLFPSLR